MNEFEMIERYFLPLTMGNDSVAGLQDDAAVLEIPQGFELVVTSDTLNENVHFLKNEAPANIARKALRVNLSDLAAMGAEPLSYQLNMAFPKKPSDDWLCKFSDALLEDNKHYNIFCSGGDTTSIKGDYLSISITALGVVPKGQAVRRSGAKDGDLVVITGVVGDAFLGLKTLQKGLDNEIYSESVKRYLCPNPRIESVNIIRKYANAAADISDGLLADVLHIGKASNLGVELDFKKISFSKYVQHALDHGLVKFKDILKGGDDYELILSVSAGNLNSLLSELRKNDLEPLVIGEFKRNNLPLRILNTDTICIDGQNLGWEHF